MANLIRWDPVSKIKGMRDIVDRAFDDFFNRSAGKNEGYGIINLDMAQNDDDVIVKASVPGVNPDDLNISVAGDTLKIRGAVRQDEEINKSDYQIREMRVGSFARSILLPNQIVADKAKIEFENGILKLTLPKAEEVKPQTITVKAK